MEKITYFIPKGNDIQNKAALKLFEKMGYSTDLYTRENPISLHKTAILFTDSSSFRGKIVNGYDKYARLSAYKYILEEGIPLQFNKNYNRKLIKIMFK